MSDNDKQLELPDLEDLSPAEDSQPEEDKPEGSVGGIKTDEGGRPMVDEGGRPLRIDDGK